MRSSRIYIKLYRCTIAGLLATGVKKPTGQSNNQNGSGNPAQNSKFIRTFHDRDEKRIGFLEIDALSYHGENTTVLQRSLRYLLTGWVVVV